MLERFKAGNYSSEDRGYSLLASEPSISAPTVLFMLLSVWFFFREGKLSPLKAALGFGIVLFLMFLNRSGTLGVLLLLVLSAYALGKLMRAGVWKRTLILGSGVIFILGGGALLLTLDIKNIRILVVLTQIVQFVIGKNKADLVTIGVRLGSERAIFLALGYKSLFHFTWGNGIASWNIPGVLTRVENAIGLNPFDYYDYIGAELAQGGQIKPQSFLSLMAFDMGVSAMIPLLWGLGAILFWGGKWITRFNDNRLVYLMPAIVWLSFFGLSTLPAPWLLFAYSLHVVRSPAAMRSLRLRVVLPSGRPRLAT